MPSLRRTERGKPALYRERHRQPADPHRRGHGGRQRDHAGAPEEAGGADGVDANVATGYHAIEFLLWGQDLNGTGPGAGNRPATDYSKPPARTGIATGARAYLKAATDLLVSDLEEMAADWEEGGAARKQLADKGPDGGLRRS